jgi:hypothetical protein
MKVITATIVQVSPNRPNRVKVLGNSWLTNTTDTPLQAGKSYRLEIDESKREITRVIIGRNYSQTDELSACYAEIDRLAGILHTCGIDASDPTGYYIRVANLDDSDIELDADIVLDDCEPDYEIERIGQYRNDKAMQREYRVSGGSDVPGIVKCLQPAYEKDRSNIDAMLNAVDGYLPHGVDRQEFLEARGIVS